jgi:hypothetical protein
MTQWIVFFSRSLGFLEKGVAVVMKQKGVEEEKGELGSECKREGGTG